MSRGRKLVWACVALVAIGVLVRLGTRPESWDLPSRVDQTPAPPLPAVLPVQAESPALPADPRAEAVQRRQDARSRISEAQQKVADRELEKARAKIREIREAYPPPPPGSLLRVPPPPIVEPPNLGPPVEPGDRSSP